MGKIRTNEMFIPYLFLLVLILACFFSGCETKNTEKLFLFKPASKSGLNFKNNLSENVDFNLFNYYNYYNGAGVALGDINNDGLLDVYFSSNLEENKLFLNKGDLNFVDISSTSKTTGSAKWSTGVTMVDINADGLLDIYVCNLGDFEHGKGQNELFINNGDLTFTESAAEYGLNTKTNATQASFFDYDNDGDLDMYLLNHSMTTINSYASRSTMLQLKDEKVGDRLFQNQSEKGIQKFTDVTEISGILSTPVGFGLGVGCSDINNDGYIDIYVSNDFHENDYLYINQKDGTFKESLSEWMSHTSKFSMGNDIADFNNDGLVDIVTMDMLPKDPEILQKSMEEAPFELREIILKNGYFPQVARNNLQLNRGKNFSDIAPLAGVHATDWSWAPLIADLDNDGYKDMYISNGIYRRPNDLDYLNYAANGVIKSVIDVKAKKVVEKLIKAIPQYPVPNFAYKNDGALGFTDVTNKWGLDIPSYSSGAAYGDLDNDGDLDFVINNINQEAFLLENTANEEEIKKSYLSIKLKGRSKNVNGIGTKVIAKSGEKTFFQEQAVTRGFMSSVSNVLHIGLGNIQTVDSLYAIWPSGAYQLLINVQSNKELVIDENNALGNYYENLSRETLNQEAETYFTSYVDAVFDGHKENAFSDIDSQYLIPRNISTEGPGLAVGDVNGDGLDDIFLTNAKNESAQLYIQAKDKTFVASKQKVFQNDSIYEGVAALFFDADQDNDLDLYIASAGNENENTADRLYTNDGKGNFNRDTNALPQLLDNTSCVKAADFDKDGDLDLFVGSRVVSGNYGLSPQSYILENDGTGAFKEISLSEDFSFMGMVTDAQWVDFNGDGWQDLIVVGEWMPITLIKNEKGTFSNAAPETIQSTEGWWNSILSDDFDNDGDIDFMAGNVGLNTRLKASPAAPVHLYLKDFDGNGSLDQIMTHYLEGKEYPFATKDLLSKQMNFLKKRFTDYNSFSGTTINTLFEPSLLKDAEVKTASEFQSFYIENLGNDKFVTHPLPIEANFAPVMSIVSRDVDEDGLKDVIIAGNFYNFNPGMGRQDASHGLLLLNKGNNKFDPAPYGKSGIRIEGQVKNMEWIVSADGSEMLVISKNNEGVDMLKLNSKL